MLVVFYSNSACARRVLFFDLHHFYYGRDSAIISFYFIFSLYSNLMSFLMSFLNAILCSVTVMLMSRMYLKRYDPA